MDILEVDPQTQVIAVISKPPGAQTLARLLVWYAIHAVDSDQPCDVVALTTNEMEQTQKERSYWSSEQKYLRGVFPGGTFCYQTQQIFRDAGVPTYSNAPLESKYKLTDSDCSVQNSIIDMGADEYTVGELVASIQEATQIV